MTVRKLALSTVTGLLFFGCAQPSAYAPPSGFTSVQELSNSRRDDKYLLKEGDVIDVKFYYNSELNETITIRPDGRISLQLIDEIVAVGKTPEELRNELRKAYASGVLRDPEVSVVVRDFGEMNIYVGGEVLNPGLVPFPGKCNALQAVFAAGGFRETAEPASVVLLRENGSDAVAFSVLDLKTALFEPDSLMNVSLRPNDLLYVPQSAIARADQFMDQYFTKLIPISKSIGFSWIYNLNPEVRVK